MNPIHRQLQDSQKEFDKKYFDDKDITTLNREGEISCVGAKEIKEFLRTSQIALLRKLREEVESIKTDLDPDEDFTAGFDIFKFRVLRLIDGAIDEELSTKQ